MALCKTALELDLQGVEKLIAQFEARGIPYVRVPLDVEEIKQFCEEQGIPNDGKARVNLAIRKAEQNTG